MRNLVRIKQEKLASFTLSDVSHIVAFLAHSPECVSFLTNADNFCHELFVSPSSHPWGPKTPGLGLRNSPPHGSSAGGGTSGGSGDKPSARDPLTVGSWILGSRWVFFVLRVFIVIDGGFGEVPLNISRLTLQQCKFLRVDLNSIVKKCLFFWLAVKAGPVSQDITWFMRTT